MVGGLGVGVEMGFETGREVALVEVARREGMVVRRSMLLRVSQKPVTKLWGVNMGTFTRRKLYVVV